MSADPTAHAFPWREEESLRSGEKVLRPTVDVALSSGDCKTITKVLIDTGSPRCVFPRGVGVLLGLEFPDFPSGAEKKIKLMGHDWPAISAFVQLVLRPFSNNEWTAEVDFVVDEGLPFGLLGFEGFLDRWAVSFNGCLNYFIVESVDDFEARLPDGLLDGLRQPT